MKYFCLLCCLGVSVSGGLTAQDTPRFTFRGCGGFATPVGNSVPPVASKYKMLHALCRIANSGGQPRLKSPTTGV